MGLNQGLDWGWGWGWAGGWHLGWDWAGIWAEAGAEEGPELGLGVPMGPGCRAAPAPAPRCHRAPPWAWGWFRCPVTPPGMGAVREGSPQRCPAHARPWHGEQHRQDPAQLHPAPRPCGRPRGQDPRGGAGGRPGIGASGREEVGPAAVSGGFLPAASCPHTPSLPATTPGPALARATDTVPPCP